MKRYNNWTDCRSLDFLFSWKVWASWQCFYKKDLL